MDEILEKFVEQAPVAVMVHATAARAIGASVLDDIFERNAQSQFTRELTFSTVARLMTQVVFRTHPTVNAAYRANAKEIPVSVTSVYNKLDGLETGISRALVAETADTMSEIFDALPANPADEPVKGLRLALSMATFWLAPTTASPAFGPTAPQPFPVCRWLCATVAPDC